MAVGLARRRRRPFSFYAEDLLRAHPLAGMRIVHRPAVVLEGFDKPTRAVVGEQWAIFVCGGVGGCERFDKTEDGRRCARWMRSVGDRLLEAGELHCGGEAARRRGRGRAGAKGPRRSAKSEDHRLGRAEGCSRSVEALRGHSRICKKSEAPSSRRRVVVGGVGDGAERGEVGGGGGGVRGSAACGGLMAPQQRRINNRTRRSSMLRPPAPLPAQDHQHLTNALIMSHSLRESSLPCAASACAVAWSRSTSSRRGHRRTRLGRLRHHFCLHHGSI